jgi:hypothetical protein
MTEHHDRDTVVVERDRGSGAMATVLGILVIIALLAAVWYFTLGPGAGGGTTTDQGGSDTQPQASLEVPGGGSGEESAEPASS